ncbi:hypothetical protein [Halorussus sp. MSC15.2]|uniref:hypothetical protein n=1 Tax=Halorussus sp. MSC15.2 TaxID=2283638 RepID=UPI0013D10076|nr:hypothetical protein [Halorussus sp. MSC15.2]NEU57057.1 hypothetical protein [Halorussus sp. MSC15.2]
MGTSGRSSSVAVITQDFRTPDECGNPEQGGGAGRESAGERVETAERTRDETDDGTRD